MSVPITYGQKMDFGSCVQMVGFPKYGHIWSLTVMYLNAETCMQLSSNNLACIA